MIDVSDHQIVWTLKMTDTCNQATGNNTSTAGAGTIRLNNIQKIQLRKQQVRDWPLPRKLEKLAVYSSCKVVDNSEIISLFYNN